jgi:protein O-GlcNAc transferase
MQAGPLAAGWEAIKRDDLQAAEAIARGALERAPQDGEAAYLLGSSLLFQNRFPEALPPLAAAARLAPRRGVGHRLGYCHLALGEFAQAEAALRREVEAYPDLIDAWNALGVALINQGRPQDALEVFLEASRRDPSSPVAHVNVANVLGDLGRGAQALPHLQRAVELDPKLADAHYNLGVLLHGLKRHEEAIASLEQAYRLAPATAYTLSHLLWNEIAVCRWDNLAVRVEALRVQARSGGPAIEPFTFIAVSSSPEEQRLCAERHVAEKVPAHLPPLSQSARYRHDRIRVAYLSGDYHEHATAYPRPGCSSSTTATASR